MELTLIWNAGAFRQFEDATAFIAEDSLVSAERFKTEVSKKLKELLLQPERYQPDKYKKKMMAVFVPLKYSDIVYLINTSRTKSVLSV